jgi:hypothetical protein
MAVLWGKHKEGFPNKYVISILGRLVLTLGFGIWSWQGQTSSNVILTWIDKRYKNRVLEYQLIICQNYTS